METAMDQNILFSIKQLHVYPTVQGGKNHFILPYYTSMDRLTISFSSRIHSSKNHSFSEPTTPGDPWPKKVRLVITRTRAFSVLVPISGNQLLPEIRVLQNLLQFHRACKAELFRQALLAELLPT